MKMIKSSKFWFWSILILMHLAFFGVALHQKNFTTKDSSEYIWQAQNLSANGSWYCGDLSQEINPALYNQRPPVYGAFLSLLASFRFKIQRVILRLRDAIWPK